MSRPLAENSGSHLNFRNRWQFQPLFLAPKANPPSLPPPPHPIYHTCSFFFPPSLLELVNLTPTSSSSLYWRTWDFSPEDTGFLSGKDWHLLVIFFLHTVAFLLPSWFRRPVPQGQLCGHGLCFIVSRCHLGYFSMDAPWGPELWSMAFCLHPHLPHHPQILLSLRLYLLLENDNSFML